MCVTLLGCGFCISEGLFSLSCSKSTVCGGVLFVLYLGCVGLVVCVIWVRSVVGVLGRCIWSALCGVGI